MIRDFELTGYDFYSSRRNMEIISSIVDALNKILEEDKKEEQPLFLKISDTLIMNIARKVVHDRKKTFLIGITGESASGKTVFVDNTIKACVKEKKDGIYTVIRCDDYYKKNHLAALKEGMTIKSPRYDFVTCESNPDGEEKKPAKVILTEGLYVLNEGIRDIMDVKVYVYTPLEVIKERWYKRAKERGKEGTAADLQFADVNKTAQQYIRPAYQISDAIINGMVSQKYIQDITDRIFKALRDIEY